MNDKQVLERTHRNRRFILRGALFGAAAMELGLYFYEGLWGVETSLFASVLRAAVFFVIFAIICLALTRGGSKKEQ